MRDDPSLLPDGHRGGPALGAPGADHATRSRVQEQRGSDPRSGRWLLAGGPSRTYREPGRVTVGRPGTVRSVHAARPSLSFGHGPHVCLGMHLRPARRPTSRLEVLLDRYRTCAWMLVTRMPASVADCSARPHAYPSSCDERRPTPVAAGRPSREHPPCPMISARRTCGSSATAPWPGASSTGPRLANALTAAMYFGIRRAVDKVNASTSLAALIITGTGDVFAPGGEMGGRSEEGAPTSRCSARGSSLRNGPRQPEAGDLARSTACARGAG